MEKFQALYKCVILLALVSFHEALVIQGRKIKSTKQKQYMRSPRDLHGSSGETRKRGSESATMIKSFDSAAPHVQYEPKTTYASHIPSTVDQSVTSKKEASVPPMKPNYSFGFRDSDAAHNKDDFRPTAPGNSPGVGHSFQNQEADVESKALAKGKGVRPSLTGFKDNYRPTVPGL
ncbi:precursor of CEP9-like [Juglans regia]|uniref:Precursor of CEP9-like n=1 Tax=Juglans regia TaxID=51240 RepID=A0A6P9EWT7_JUGRE|nr:precursor of CEP9-like [Juglans regia]